MPKHTDGNTNENQAKQNERRQGVEAKRNLEKKGAKNPEQPKHRKGK
jgi:hypothetical protein